jgi:3-deoxy-D-manno-octulosonic-acid transferase
MIQNSEELGQAVARLMAIQEERQAFGERALAVVNKHRGALDRVVEGIVERL